MRFIVFGDSKGKEKSGINEKVLKKIMNESTKIEPAPQFIVVCGDTVAGSSKEEVLASQLSRFRNIIENYHPNKLLLPIVGNHEVNIKPIDDRFEKVLSQIYNNLIPDSHLEGYNKTVYYKDFEDTRLIILNAFHFGSTHKISEDQLSWFKEAASKCIRNKLVFIHSPAFPTGAHLSHCLDFYPEYRDAFWKIVDECGIDIVFSGHEHNYSRRIVDDSFDNVDNCYKRKVTQVITGGGGEKLRDKYKSKQGIVVAPIAVYHYLVVDIEEDYIKVCAISSKGKKLDEFVIDKTSV